MWHVLSVVVIASLLLAACATPTTEAPKPTVAPGGKQRPAATVAPAATSGSRSNCCPGSHRRADSPPPPKREAKGGIRKSASGFKGTLNLWVLGYTPGNQFANPFDNAVAQFMLDNPDIKVEITGYPPNDEGFTKLNTALQSGQGIDLLRLPSGSLARHGARRSHRTD